MSNPQQPELARSRKTPAQDPQAAAAVVEGQHEPGADAPRGPVPPENQPGHHPEQEQDKPDLDAFAERLGVVEEAGTPPPDAAEVTPTARLESEPTTPVAAVKSRLAGKLPAVAAGGAGVAAIGGVLLVRHRRRARRR